MAAIETRLTGLALGAIIGLLCCVLLIAGLLDFGVGLWVAAVTLGAAWIILCVYRSLLAFSILLLVFVLAYARLGLPLISVEGPGNRGVGRGSKEGRSLVREAGAAVVAEWRDGWQQRLHGATRRRRRH